MTHKEWLEKKGGCAFPTIEAGSEYGMTLRDYFAAKAMASILANPDLMSISDDVVWATTKRRDEWVSEQAYAFADAMLAERAK